MIFVLTHGEAKEKLHARDKTYDTDKIWKYFLGDACPSLQQKPKIFFFVVSQLKYTQYLFTPNKRDSFILVPFAKACRGDETDAGQQLLLTAPRRSATKTDATRARGTYTIPTHIDMLMVYSTIPGKKKTLRSLRK